jgi:hypothetical protein
MFCIHGGDQGSMKLVTPFQTTNETIYWKALLAKDNILKNRVSIRTVLRDSAEWLLYYSNK